LEAYRRSDRSAHFADAARTLEAGLPPFALGRHRSLAMRALLTKTVSDWFRHRSARLGAALAYYSVFSLGPLLLIVTAIAGLFFGADAARRSITSQFRSMIGETGGQAVEVMLKGAESSTAGGWTAALGIGLLLVAALGVVVQLRDALNTIFDVKEPEDAGIAWYAKVYAMCFAGILALGFLLAVSLIISAVLAAFSAWLSDSAAESLLLMLLSFAVSLAVLTLLFSMLFRWLPDRQLAWRDVWLGGFVTALLFNIGKSAIAWYIGTQGFESTYGAAASIVVLLIWVYYSAQIVLFGAELTQAYAAQRVTGERHG
jgi:membrane protein